MKPDSHSNVTVSGGFARLSLALFGGTLALIALGGLVRITGSGLGCPDWPLCHGRLIPPFELAPWIEYVHRLAAASVSVMVVAFSALAWLRYRGQAWVLWPAIVAPAFLVAQIVLGRLTVVNEIPPGIAWIHTAVAMAILACVAVPVAAIFSPLAQTSRRLARLAVGAAQPVRLPALLTLAALLVYFVLLTGAYVTRSGAAAACPGFPACGAADSAGALAIRLQSIHMLHRVVATGAAIMAALALWECWRTGDRGLRTLASGTAVVLATQACLGVANVLLRLPLWSRGLHLAIAAVLWASIILLVTTTWRGWWTAIGSTEPAVADGRIA